MASPVLPKASFELKRFFVPLSSALQSFPQAIEVTDETTVHHLRTVMRAKAGERVVIVDAERQQAYQAVISNLERHALSLQVEGLLPDSNEGLPHITLIAALIKEQRWDTLLQKSTELGVNTIQPVFSERSIIRLDERDFAKKQERWQSVARSAAEQSEGLFIPPVETPQTLTSLFKSIPTNAFKLLLQERGDTRPVMRDILRSRKSDQSIWIAIGPEGGWTDTEIQAFQDAGFIGVSLGQRVLRSETAAMAAMAALVYETGC